MFKTFLYKHHWLIPTIKLILGFVCHSHTHSVFLHGVWLCFHYSYAGFTCAGGWWQDWAACLLHLIIYEAMLVFCMLVCVDIMHMLVWKGKVFWHLCFFVPNVIKLGASFHPPRYFPLFFVFFPLVQKKSSVEGQWASVLAELGETGSILSVSSTLKPVEICR